MSTPQWSMAKTPKNSYQTLNIDDCFCCAKEKKRSHAIRLYRSVWHFLPDFFFFFLPTLLLLPSPKNSLTHQSIFFPKSNLWKIEEEKGAWSKNEKMNWLIFLDDFLQLAWMLSDPSHNQNGCFNTRCLKITEKVSLRTKMPKMANLTSFWSTTGLQKIQKRHFEWFSKMVSGYWIQD